MKASILRAVDANRVPMVGAEPGLRDLQRFLRDRAGLRLQLLGWLRTLEEIRAGEAEQEERDPPTGDTEDP